MMKKGTVRGPKYVGGSGASGCKRFGKSKLVKDGEQIDYKRDNANSKKT